MLLGRKIFIISVAFLVVFVHGKEKRNDGVCPKKCILCEKNDTSWEILSAVCQDVRISELAGPVKHVHIYDGTPDKIPSGILKDFLFLGIEDLTFLKVENYGLKYIWGSPLINNTHLEILDLTDNEISEISAESFLGPTDLHVLILSKNNISNIPNDTFSDLQGLTNLNLSYNHLDSISQKLFYGLPKLTDLDLSHNEIDPLSLKDALKDLSTVEKLKLSYNQWQSVPPKLFTGLPHLYFLSLEGNNLETISPSDFMGTSVTILNLSNNNFTHIPSQALEKLSKYDLIFNISENSIEKLDDLGNITVGYLDLSGNGIKEIQDPNVFFNSHITTLDLHNNQLKSLPQSMELYLRVMENRELILYDNPWDCTCDIKWLASYVFFHYSRHEPVCKTPPKYAGKKLSKIKWDLERNCLHSTTTTTKAVTSTITPMATTKFSTIPNQTFPTSISKITSNFSKLVTHSFENTTTATVKSSPRSNMPSTALTSDQTSIFNSVTSEKTTIPANFSTRSENLTTSQDVTFPSVTLSITSEATTSSMKLQNTTTEVLSSTLTGQENTKTKSSFTPMTPQTSEYSTLFQFSTKENVVPNTLEQIISTENATSIEQTSKIPNTAEQTSAQIENTSLSSKLATSTGNSNRETSSTSQTTSEISTTLYHTSMAENSGRPGMTTSQNHPSKTSLPLSKSTDQTNGVSFIGFTTSDESHGSISKFSTLENFKSTETTNKISFSDMASSTDEQDRNTTKQYSEITTEISDTKPETTGISRGPENTYPSSTFTEMNTSQEKTSEYWQTTQTYDRLTEQLSVSLTTAQQRTTINHNIEQSETNVSPNVTHTETTATQNPSESETMTNENLPFRESTTSRFIQQLTTNATDNTQTTQETTAERITQPEATKLTDITSQTLVETSSETVIHYKQTTVAYTEATPQYSLNRQTETKNENNKFSETTESAFSSSFSQASSSGIATSPTSTGSSKPVTNQLTTETTGSLLELTSQTHTKIETSQVETTTQENVPTTIEEQLENTTAGQTSIFLTHSDSTTKTKMLYSIMQTTDMRESTNLTTELRNKSTAVIDHGTTPISSTSLTTSENLKTTTTPSHQTQTFQSGTPSNGSMTTGTIQFSTINSNPTKIAASYSPGKINESNHTITKSFTQRKTTESIITDHLLLTNTTIALIKTTKAASSPSFTSTRNTSYSPSLNPMISLANSKNSTTVHYTENRSPSNGIIKISTESRSSQPTSENFDHTKETVENTVTIPTKQSMTTTERMTTQTGEINTPTQKLTTKTANRSGASQSTNQVHSSFVLGTTQLLSTNSTASVSNGVPVIISTSTPAISINQTVAQKTLSESMKTSIAAIVAPILALLIISCLGFLIFAGIKRSLLNKITDKILCSNEEDFFMPTKEFDQAKPMFNRKVKSGYSVFVTENDDCCENI